jgi:hypothetical protein
MKLLLAGLIGALIGVACTVTVAYYEWWENEPEDEAVITDQQSQPDRPRPIEPKK